MEDNDMNAATSNKKDVYTFFKHSIIQPSQNTKNNNYLSVPNNILLLFLLFISAAFISFIAYIPIFLVSTGFEDYTSTNFFFIIFGLIVYLFFMPGMLVNIFVLYLLNKKYGSSVKNFKKVLSDHTAIWLSTFLLYAIGLYFYSYMESFGPYITLAGTLIIFISIILYLRRSILLARHYVSKGNRLKANIYAVILIIIVLFGLPLILNNIFEGMFIEQPLVNLLRLFEALRII